MESPCALCGASGGTVPGLCDPCLDEVRPGVQLGAPCSRCALPLHGDAAISLCGACQTRPPPFASTYRFTVYQPPVDRMIQHLKFHNKLFFARLLGTLMAQDIRQRRVTQPDVLLPVPLHPARLRQRGYNQALEISRDIARQLRLPVDWRCCERCKATPEQAGLPADQRGGNIKGAFRVTGDVRGRHIAVVDDVMTTGSTVTELAQTLLKQGAKRVDVWVCARAVLS